MSATASSAADSHGSGFAPARSETASALIPSWLAVSAAPTVPEWSTERPTLTPWLMPGEHEVGLGPDRPESAGDDREGGGGIEPVGLHLLGALHEGPLVADGRVIGHRADGGTGAAVVGAGRHHDDLVRRSARPSSALVGPGHQGPRERRQPRGAHPVVVGDENPHGGLTLSPAVRGSPGPDIRRSGPCHPGFTRGRRTPHPRCGPGLLQFTRNARPLAQDLRRLAHRAAVAHRARPPGGHRLRGGRHAPGLLGGPRPRSSTASGPTSGPIRAGARSSPRGPTASPTGATSSTGCGPRPPWTSRSAATPSTAWCAGCPGRSRPGTRTSSPSGCSSTPRPATRSPSCSSSSTTWAGTG